MSIEHTIDATRRAAGGAVKEIKRLDDEIARLEGELADYKRCSLEWGKQMNEHMDQIQRLQAVIAADCQRCGRALPGDGDCYGCQADRLQAVVDAARAECKRLASIRVASPDDGPSLHNYQTGEIDAATLILCKLDGEP